MPLTWTLEDQPDHLLVHLDGQWQLQSLLKMIDEAGRRCHERGYSRLLCDLRAVRGPLSETDRYLAGTRIAEVLKAVKVAAVVAADAVITGFAGKVAERRGGRLFVTKDIDEALQWLFA
jgi:hypothetical protein